ncbi:MAG TPA: DNA-binding domain-containing protein [Steroidobacteraceae bacterium]
MSPPLAALQGQMAAALMAADPVAQELPEQLFAGAHPGTIGLRVHRNTVLGALSNALRASFKSVEHLVGEAFFDRMAVAYARSRPPQAPQLDAYGAEFPAFIAGFPGTEALPYLAELACFDWQLDELGRQRAGSLGGADQLASGRSLLLEGGARLHFAASLRLHEARYPVDELREAILAEDTETLALIGRRTGDYHYALWRAQQGVKLSRLGAAAAAFLGAALDGADAERAISAAAAAGAGKEVAGLLAAEILPAGFLRIEAATPDKNG